MCIQHSFFLPKLLALRFLKGQRRMESRQNASQENCYRVNIIPLPHNQISDYENPFAYVACKVKHEASIYILTAIIFYLARVERSHHTKTFQWSVTRKIFLLEKKWSEQMLTESHTKRWYVNVKLLTRWLAVHHQQSLHRIKSYSTFVHLLFFLSTVAEFLSGLWHPRSHCPLFEVQPKYNAQFQLTQYSPQSIKLIVHYILFWGYTQINNYTLRCNFLLAYWSTFSHLSL